MTRHNTKSAFRWLRIHAGKSLASARRARLRSMPKFAIIDSILFLLAIVAALSCLVSLVIYFGFDHSADEYRLLRKIMHGSQLVFAAQIVVSALPHSRRAPRLRSRVLHLCFEIPVLLTLIPLIYPRPEHPWIAIIDSVLYSGFFLYAALTAYSVVIICLGITRAFNRRTNPSLMLSISFLAFILIGSMLLSLPKCNVTPISYIDALFVSTSAVCITGLTSVDVATQFTPMGLLMLALLIQIGALGVMTFTCFFALFFTGNATIYSQLMLKDIVYTRSMNSLIPTLLYVLSFTLAIELIGAAAIWWSVHGTIGLSNTDCIIFALFHSLSAFCNAGFSTLPGGMSNPALLYGNQSIYWITTVLIVAGAIGFPILVNFKDALVSKLKSLGLNKLNFLETRVPIHLYNMNTKIVLSVFFILMAAGAVLFFIFEADNTLAGMTLSERITQSVFNSAVPRSAGFSSVNPSRFLNITLLMVMFLMWVGGASQSTAGGIKVNTLAAICYNLKAIVTGSPRVTAFNRNIAVGSIRRANAVVALSIFSYTLVTLILFGLEPALSARDLAFESLSALFTVGSSLGITDRLSDESLGLLCAAMFMGRVGIISLLTGIVPTAPSCTVSYPDDIIIIS